MAEWIIGHFPAHEAYVEPYGGAASVLMRKPPSGAEVYNDINGDIVNVFRVLRDEGEARRLCRQLELTAFARDEYGLSFARSEDAVERARRTIVRSFMGYGCKSLSNGEKNGWRSKRLGSSWPASDWQSYPHQIRAFVERLRGVTVENRPALEVMKTYDSPGTLHYVDPPYLPETRSVRCRKVYQFEMTEADHIELAKALKSLQGMIVLSGYGSPLYGSLFAGWDTDRKKTRCASGGTRTEVLYISPSASDRAKQKSLWEYERLARR